MICTNALSLAYSGVELYNEAIVNDPSWGSNPPAADFSPKALPPKPSTKLRELTMGQRDTLPRDRPFVSPTSTTAARTHLPQPAFGHTFGHGFSTVRNFLLAVFFSFFLLSSFYLFNHYTYIIMIVST
jgi:hypothetical protein